MRGLLAAATVVVIVLARSHPASAAPTVVATFSYLSIDAPGAFLTGFSYDVPAGEVDVIRYATVCIQRQTAAVVAGRFDAGIAVYPYGPSWTPPTGQALAIHLEAWVFDNTVGAQSCHFGLEGVMLPAGARLAGSRVDASTGGTVLYQLEAVVDRYGSASDRPEAGLAQISDQLQHLAAFLMFTLVIFVVGLVMLVATSFVNGLPPRG